MKKINGKETIYAYALFDKDEKLVKIARVIVENPTSIIWNDRTFVINSVGNYSEGPCKVATTLPDGEEKAKTICGKVSS